MLEELILTFSERHFQLAVTLLLFINVFISDLQDVDTPYSEIL